MSIFKDICLAAIRNENLPLVCGYIADDVKSCEDLESLISMVSDWLADLEDFREELDDDSDD